MRMNDVDLKGKNEEKIFLGLRVNRMCFTSIPFKRKSGISQRDPVRLCVVSLIGCRLAAELSSCCVLSLIGSPARCLFVCCAGHVVCDPWLICFRVAAARVHAHRYFRWGKSNENIFEFPY